MKGSVVVSIIVVLFFSCRHNTTREKFSLYVDHFTDHNKKNSEDEKSFIINAVNQSYEFIEVAEIAQQRGSQFISSQATALKDGYVNVLHKLIDYADLKSINLPEDNLSNEMFKEFLQIHHSDFDGRWQREAVRQNEKMISDFENFTTTDPNLRELISEIVSTLRFNRTILSENVVSNN